MTDTITPNKDRLRLWVAALRSGKYRQCRGELTDDGGYCCLGVACDISQLGAWDGESYVVAGEYLRGILPPAVADWYGLPAQNPDIAPADDHRSFPVRASVANDDFGCDFDQIADAIEEYYDLVEETRTGEAAGDHG